MLNEISSKGQKENSSKLFPEDKTREEGASNEIYLEYTKAIFE